MTTIDRYLQMPSSHILALVISELSQKRAEKARMTGETIHPCDEENEARARFGCLPDNVRARALMWIVGKRRPGSEWDNRRITG